MWHLVSLTHDGKNDRFGYKLQSGIVTSVEPGIYLFGKYGCRIEDLVLIEKGGISNFASSPKELIEIY